MNTSADDGYDEREGGSEGRGGQGAATGTDPDAGTGTAAGVAPAADPGAEPGRAASTDAAEGAPERAGYRRSAGSPRGEARRRELLERVTRDLAVNGLVDFSLRRAARAAGTTHKVLLYHFDGADDLLVQAVVQLRARRIDKSLAAAAGEGRGRRSLAEWVRAVWPILVGEEARVLDQAIGLAMYDPDRYAALGREASQQYLPTLLAACPEHWPRQRKLQVAEMVLAVLRGFLVDARTSGDDEGIAAGFEALARALEREEAAPE
jgi:AcrR family transcriptional regulator